MEMCRYGKHIKTEIYERPDGSKECRQCRREAVRAFNERARQALRLVREQGIDV